MQEGVSGKERDRGRRKKPKITEGKGSEMEIL